MKIGILTFQQAINYGAVLQLYALQKIIQKLGADPEVINYISPKLKNDYKIIRRNDGLRNLLASIFCAKAFCERKRRFKVFEKKYLNLTNELYSKRDLSRICNKYDYLITGSDQVWNYTITNTDFTYMLDFVEDSNKKISYAASFGVAQIPDKLKIWYKNLLQDFKAISVREKQGKAIIKSLCNKEVSVVLDPTFLLTKEDWKKLNTCDTKNKKYILVYCLRRSDLLNEFAEKLKIKTGFKIIVLNPRTKKIYSQSSAYSAGPEEFIGLFMNAEYVLTNSFHGTAFSINFNKNFLVDLDINSTVSTNSRLLNILSLLGLEDRIIDNIDIEKMYQDIDYSKVNTILDEERRKSINYLKMSLGLNE